MKSILIPNEIIALDSGTIFFLFLSFFIFIFYFIFNLHNERTLALGGHFLQCTSINRWLQVVNYQISNPSDANAGEKCGALNYVRVVEGSVKKGQGAVRWETLVERSCCCGVLLEGEGKRNALE